MMSVSLEVVASNQCSVCKETKKKGSKEIDGRRILRREEKENKDKKDKKKDQTKYNVLNLWICYIYPFKVYSCTTELIMVLLSDGFDSSLARSSLSLPGMTCCG
jgi:hypothetical protein